MSRVAWREVGARMTVAHHTSVSSQAIAEQILDAIRAHTPLRIVGAGSWLDVPASPTLSMAEHAGIVEYVPGDLTLTARAGTTLAEIASATAEANQWLTLDPFGSEQGTIGATIATASWGPLATGYGLPRDIVLGVEAVTGDGAVIRGGGRVVKNVAGFDLVRMLTGSWGTLAVLTEVAVRLRAKPERDETVAVALPRDDGDGATRVWKAVRRWPFTPIAVELLNANLARATTSHDAPVALFRLAGNDEMVAAQSASIAALGDRVHVDSAVWSRLRGAAPKGAWVARLSALPARIEEPWSAATELAKLNANTLVHASVARGVVRCIVPSNASAPELSSIESFSGTVVWENRTPAGRPHSPRSTSALERRLLETFNPHGILNPGVFGTPCRELRAPRNAARRCSRRDRRVRALRLLPSGVPDVPHARG
jgi:glycolate oxidase FAD binding subunit